MSSAGARVIRKYWKIKAGIVNYGYPVDPSQASISLEDVKQFNANRNFGPRKRICYAPFNNMHFSNNGRVAACSFNTDFYIGDINKNNIHDIWFGEDAEAFRADLASYNFRKCMNCQSILETGNFSAFPPLKYDLHGSNETQYPTQMSFETSNTCNLECVMCSGEFSSLIRTKREKLPPLRYKYPADFREQILEFIPHLKIASFIGGEPLLIKDYFGIWEDIVRVNPKCNIHIQTNATLLPEQFLQLIKNGNFDIGISIDAVSKTLLEAIRINVNFEEVQANIDRLVKLQEEGQVHLNFNFCPLTMNWQELPAMVEYSNDRNVSLKILNVDYPTHLALRYRPADYLKEVIQFLQSNRPYEQKGNFTLENNLRAYDQMIDQVATMITRAEFREQKFAELDSLDFDNTLKAFHKEIIDNPIFETMPVGERQQLSEICKDYVTSEKISSMDERRDTIAHLIVHLRAVEGEKVSQRSVEDCFDSFKKVADGFIVMESENNRQANLTP